MRKEQVRRGERLSQRKWLLIVFASLVTVHCSLFTIYAQDEPVPPPPQVVSKEERNKLDAASSTKERTKRSLDLINGHLTAAEQLTANVNIEGSYAELGRVHALIDDALAYLIARDKMGEKVLDSFKRLEMALRTVATRIEGIHREVPIKYEDYIQALLKRVRDVRARAADMFFDDTVVKQPDSI